MGEGSGGGAAAGIVSLLVMVIQLAVFGVVIAGMWKLFVKAGQPGWAAIVPIYNQYVLTTQIAGRPILWFILMLVPCVNIVAAILVMIDVAKSFGKDTGYAIGMVLLPFIFIPMLGFGDAQYGGPAFKG